MITLLKLLMTNLATLFIYQVANNSIELFKIKVLVDINRTQKSITYKYLTNIFIFAFLAFIVFMVMEIYIMPPEK